MVANKFFSPASIQAIHFVIPVLIQIRSQGDIDPDRIPVSQLFKGYLYYTFRDSKEPWGSLWIQIPAYYKYQYLGGE